MQGRNNRGWDVSKRRGVVVLDGLFLVFGLILMVGAIVVFVWFTLPSITEARASTGWSSTPGRIVHSRIDVSYDSDNKRSEKAVVQYLYMVEGVELIGDRVSIGAGFRDAMKTKKLYPVGREVEVFIDPERSWQSALEPGVHFSAQMLFPIVMLVLGIPFTLLPLRSLRKGRGGSADIEKKMPARSAVVSSFWGARSSSLGARSRSFSWSCLGGRPLITSEGLGGPSAMGPSLRAISNQQSPARASGSAESSSSTTMEARSTAARTTDMKW